MPVDTYFALADCLAESKQYKDALLAVARTRQVVAGLPEDQRNAYAEKLARLHIRIADDSGNPRLLIKAVGANFKQLSGEQRTEALYMRIKALSEIDNHQVIAKTLERDYELLKDTKRDGYVTLQYYRSLMQLERVDEAKALMDAYAKRQAEARIETDAAAELAVLPRYRPTSVDFAIYQANLVPVKRTLPELTAMIIEVPAPAPAPPPPPPPKPKPPLPKPKPPPPPPPKKLFGKKAGSFEGMTNDWKVVKKWNSGRFYQHGPGGGAANPPTTCSASIVEIKGRAHLHIVFICEDPSLNSLVLTKSGAVMYDDSVEVFLDVDNDRHDYHQMIVTAGGRYWSGYFDSPTHFGGARAMIPWKSDPKVRSEIDRQTGQWTCEILIDFSKLKGVPKAGTRWTANFCRNFRGQVLGRSDHWQTAFPAFEEGQNYHKPHLFGVLQW